MNSFNHHTLTLEAPPPTSRSAWNQTAIERFTAQVNVLGSLSYPSPILQARLLEELKKLARQVGGNTEKGLPSGYDRLVLAEVPERWSLAAIILRPGQEIHPHNHEGWGCAATIQGVERNRLYVQADSGELVLSSERDYPAGAGYGFNADAIHQPFGADPRRVTVALHFLVYQDLT